MRRLNTVAAGLLVAIAMAACAADPGGTAAPLSTAAGVPDEPCALLAAGEAAGAINSDPLTAASHPGDPALCTYGGSIGQGAVQVTVIRNNAQQQYDGAVSSNMFTPVEGVGDKAVAQNGDLWFMVNGVTINVKTSFGGNDKDRASAILIGKIITARITTGAVPPELFVTPPPVLSSKDPCKLLSNEEAAAALGVDPLTSTNNDSGASNQPIFCFYSYLDGTAVMSTFLDPKDAAANWESTVVPDIFEPQTVEGLGDKALFEDTSGKLFVLKGDSLLVVNVFTSNLGSVLEADRKIMEILLSHL